MNSEEDYEIKLSALSQTYTEGDKSINVEIYKGENDEGWLLEILDGLGNSMISDELFSTEQKALDQFLELM